MTNDIYQILDSFDLRGTTWHYYSLSKLAEKLGPLNHLPYSLRIILEGMLRKYDGVRISKQDIENLVSWKPNGPRLTMPVMVGRVVLQDFTGVPVMNDLAAMRSSLVKAGGDAEKVNPLVPVDLVIDHSVQVDYYGTAEAFDQNNATEMKRNQERYEYLRWAQSAFNNFRVVPPASGIVHQINLECLTRLAMTAEIPQGKLAYTESLVGTDSHTTMINGLGVVGWGVGGIEAVAAMLAEPIELLAPDVIGIKLNGELKPGVTPTDLTLSLVQMLRRIGVVDKFVEFTGPSLARTGIADRAMIANMTPETGATMLYFPVDQVSLNYLSYTGRDSSLAGELFRRQGLLHDTGDAEAQFSLLVEVDLSTIEPSVAGPKRPQDRLPLYELKQAFRESLIKPKTERGYGLSKDQLDRKSTITLAGRPVELRHGSIVLTAITSCTNTSNPYVMVAAGLLARKAREKGLASRSWVKASLAPGSKVVTAYLEKAGLMDDLAYAGFHLVGYGCTTCIGNSGPLNPAVVAGINENNLVSGAVISGNRNFEGRVHPHVQANFLASPPLVVAFSLAGTVDIDITREPIGTDKENRPVYLRDIWPSDEQVAKLVAETITPEMFTDSYSQVYDGNPQWNAIQPDEGRLYQWKDSSTYVQEPPFFENLNQKAAADISGARVLVILGDSVTTDHISPAGNIAINSVAGQYLIQQGVKPEDFNSYGSRRGNDRVMSRGTFANIRIKNLMLDGEEGSFTLHQPDGEKMTIFGAAEKYRTEGTPLVVIAGKEYGTGSSRDWAAKGPLLLGVRAVIAESFERIHRSNLAGMGILPLQFIDGQNAASLRLLGTETITISDLVNLNKPASIVTVNVQRANGEKTSFMAIARLDTANEVRYFQGGGILNNLVRGLLE